MTETRKPTRKRATPAEKKPAAKKPASRKVAAAKEKAPPKAASRRKKVAAPAVDAHVAVLVEPTLEAIEDASPAPEAAVPQATPKRVRRPRKKPAEDIVAAPRYDDDGAGDDLEEPETDGDGLDDGAVAGVAAELAAAAASSGLWDDAETGVDGEDEDDPLDFVLDAEPLVDPKDPLQVAAARLGILRLHAEQRRVIESVLAGRDVLMILPTGFGKSACYQVPSMVLPKPTLVISPLLALMRDQYEKLLKYDVPVVRLDGTVRGKHRKAAMERIAQGGSLLVMTTPETLATEDAVNSLSKSGVSLAAIDEAHCISEWGYDFRPTYLQLGERLRRLGAPPVLALTATATEKVRSAIIRFVGMRDPEIIATSPHRSNLAFDVLRCSGDQRLRALMRLVLRLRRPGIIYCSTTREVDTIYALLHRFGAPAHRYHGKMGAGDREKQQDAFMRRGRRTVMVATNAFGLGGDKQDIRYVRHYQSPAALESYVQEAGRAGRDGRRANCILLFSREDRLIHEALLARSRIRPEQLYKLARALAGWAGEGKVPTLEALAVSADLGVKTAGALLAVLEEATLVKWDQTAVFVTVPADEIEVEARKLAGQFETLRSQDARRLDSIAAFAENDGCRAVFLREYFGEEGSEPCGMCDVCRGANERPSMFYEPLEAPRHAPRRQQGRRNLRNGRGGEPQRGRRGGNGQRRGRGGPPQGEPRRDFRPPRPGMAPFDPAAAAGQPDGVRSRRRRGRRRGRNRGPGTEPDASMAGGAPRPDARPPRFQRPPGDFHGSPRDSNLAGGERGPDGNPRQGRRRRRRRGRGRRGGGPGNPGSDGSGAPQGGDQPGSSS